MVKSDEQDWKKRESLITADGQIIIVLREELRRAQVDRRGGESRGNTPLEQKENNISPLCDFPREEAEERSSGRERILLVAENVSLCLTAVVV